MQMPTKSDHLLRESIDRFVDLGSPVGRHISPQSTQRSRGRRT
jgi:hypothetical protein